jgi:hypothetical protein
VSLDSARRSALRAAYGHEALRSFWQALRQRLEKAGGNPAKTFPVDGPRSLACDDFGNLFVTSTATVRLLPATDDHVVDGNGAVQTIYGAPPRDHFPASVTSCLTGLAVTGPTHVQVADACAVCSSSSREARRESGGARFVLVACGDNGAVVKDAGPDACTDCAAACIDPDRLRGSRAVPIPTQRRCCVPSPIRRRTATRAAQRDLHRRLVRRPRAATASSSSAKTATSARERTEHRLRSGFTLSRHVADCVTITIRARHRIVRRRHRVGTRGPALHHDRPLGDGTACGASHICLTNACTAGVCGSS